MGTKASKDARKTHGAEKKGDIFYIDPEKLTLVTDRNRTLTTGACTTSRARSSS